MMCDLMAAAENTIFYYPEAKLGTTVGMISSLAARMPHKLAMEMMLLGSKVSAQRAYEVGFVNRVVPNGTHEAEALAMAEQMPESAPLVMAALKRLAAEVLPGGPVERMVAVSQVLGAGARERGHAGRHPRAQGTPQAGVPRTLNPACAVAPARPGRLTTARDVVAAALASPGNVGGRPLAARAGNLYGPPHSRQHGDAPCRRFRTARNTRAICSSRG